MSPDGRLRILIQYLSSRIRIDLDPVLRARLLSRLAELRDLARARPGIHKPNPSLLRTSACTHRPAAKAIARAACSDDRLPTAQSPGFVIEPKT